MTRPRRSWRRGIRPAGGRRPARSGAGGAACAFIHHGDSPRWNSQQTAQGDDNDGIPPVGRALGGIRTPSMAHKGPTHHGQEHREPGRIPAGRGAARTGLRPGARPASAGPKRRRRLPRARPLDRASSGPYRSPRFRRSRCRRSPAACSTRGPGRPRRTRQRTVVPARRPSRRAAARIGIRPGIARPCLLSGSPNHTMTLAPVLEPLITGVVSPDPIGNPGVGKGVEGGRRRIV